MKRSTDDVTIRDAQLADCAAIADLVCQLGYETSAVEMQGRLQAVLGNPNYATIVAVTETGVCGMIGTISFPSYEHNDLSGHIIAMVVTKEKRGRGIGRQLIAAAEKEFARKGIRRIAVNTRLTRFEAHKFYEAIGFERNGHRFVKRLA